MSLKLDQKIENQFVQYCERKDVKPDEALNWLIKNWNEKERRSYIIPDERVFPPRGY